MPLEKWVYWFVPGNKLWAGCIEEGFGEVSVFGVKPSSKVLAYCLPETKRPGSSQTLFL